MRIKATLAVIHYRIREDTRNALYKEYISRGIRLITENTAKTSGGSYIKMDFADIIHPKSEDTRTAEDVVAEVIKSAGLEVIP